MTISSRLTFKPLLQRSAVALAMAALSVGASAALPAFTLDPTAASLSGPSFAGDNLLISNYSTIRFDGFGGFTDTGFLSVSAVQLLGTTFAPAGLNAVSGLGYGMYFAFTGAGTTTLGNPALVPTIATFTSLTFTMYGYNGLASFGFDGSNNPTETASGEVALATGTMISANGVTVPTGDGLTFNPSAAAKLTFDTSGAPAGFFATPNPFYDVAFAAFTNTTSQVHPFAGGFSIDQGGGAVNFAATPVPEPETYALMLGGLAAVGFIARRRRT